MHLIGNMVFLYVFGRAIEEEAGADVTAIAFLVGGYGKTLAQLAIAWNLCQPGVTTALTGARRLEQVEENAGGAGWQISPSDLDEIEDIVAGLIDLE